MAYPGLDFQMRALNLFPFLLVFAPVKLSERAGSSVEKELLGPMQTPEGPIYLKDPETRMTLLDRVVSIPDHFEYNLDEFTNLITVVQANIYRGRHDFAQACHPRSEYLRKKIFLSVLTALSTSLVHVELTKGFLENADTYFDRYLECLVIGSMAMFSRVREILYIWMLPILNDEQFDCLDEIRKTAEVVKREPTLKNVLSFRKSAVAIYRLSDAFNKRCAQNPKVPTLTLNFLIKVLFSIGLTFVDFLCSKLVKRKPGGFNMNTGFQTQT